MVNESRNNVLSPLTMRRSVVLVLLSWLVIVSKVIIIKDCMRLANYSVLQGQKKGKEEGESLIECYTCGLETEDPEMDNVGPLVNISN